MSLTTLRVSSTAVQPAAPETTNPNLQMCVFDATGVETTCASDALHVNSVLVSGVKSTQLSSPDTSSASSSVSPTLSCENNINIDTAALPSMKTEVGNVNVDMDTLKKQLHFQSHKYMDQQAQASQLTEDPRALQLALELSMVGLNDNDNDQTCAASGHAGFFQPSQSQQLHQQQQQFSLAALSHVGIQREFDLNSLHHSLSAVIAASGGGGGTGVGATQLNNLYANATAVMTPPPGILIPTGGGMLDERSKKSQNMTECVPVPSSEHVAEIVGRQGCKIKALRAKTNTYIKTPVRGEEPVFVVTGRKEDVSKAKREILSAADHFSLIRATRKPSSSHMDTNNINNAAVGGSSMGGGSGNSCRTPSGPLPLPGQITIQVRVPYRVVGLVVGPKGATIKHIQHETQTYIVTPSREKEPIFEVTGMPENVQTARKQIEAHIALRTGNLSNNQHNGGSEHTNGGICGGIGVAIDSSDVPTIHTINTLSQMLNDELNPDFLASLYKNGLCATLAVDNVASDVLPGVDSFTAHALNFNTGDTTGTDTDCSSLRLAIPPGGVGGGGGGVNVRLGGALVMNSNIETSTELPLQQNTANEIVGMLQNGNGQPSVTKSMRIFTGAAVTATTCSNVGNVKIINGLTRSCSSASSTASTKSTNNSAGDSSSSPPELMNIWKNMSDALDVDEGIGESPNIWNLPAATLPPGLTVSHGSPAASISPTDSYLGDNHHHQLQQQQQQHKQLQQVNNMNSSSSSNNVCGVAAAISGNAALALRRECFVCSKKEVTTALVPCGHNMFCMECANNICASIEAICPICSSVVYHAMRILA